MFKKWFGRKPEPRVTPVEPPKSEPRANLFGATRIGPSEFDAIEQDKVDKKVFQRKFPGATSPNGATMAMDALTTQPNLTLGQTIPVAQLNWFASQSYIGYNTCAMLAQHWLIGKACLMPAEDAVRRGHEITVNDGKEIDTEILDDIRRLDHDYSLTKNLIEFVQMGRIFGIRIALFKVETEDPVTYYQNPFNPDGIKPGSYKGISQIDPYWMAPELDAAAAGDPSSIHFQEPTWWRIGKLRIHRTHLVIFRTEQVPDILKPTYIWGGIPIPQKIYNRVYCAERSADEAPHLLLTKRSNILKLDVAAALANQPAFDAKMQAYVNNRDNYALKTIDLEDEMEQFDTSLAETVEVTRNQYELVAAAAEVPANKLLGTTPNGLNATGEYEEASYHERLESLQAHYLTPLIDRHHLLIIRSEICPKYNIAPFSVTTSWNALDAMTAEEQAALNKSKAETGAMLMNSGAIDGYDERQRIINDPMSGYSGLDDREPEVEEGDESSLDTE